MFPTVVVSREIRIRGIVQGVGFRPFIYNLAQSTGVAGSVRNSSSGVTIVIEGLEQDVDRFLHLLPLQPPPLAKIEEITISDTAPTGATCFSIDESVTDDAEFVLVSPDVATCDECWKEVTDPRNRRYAYPFTNCTNCGPRYTIIQDIPYDRPLTTMAAFHMCAECEAEYHDPANRRFHAQPNACPVCGPQLCLVKAVNSAAECSRAGQVEILSDVRRLLHEGEIVAIKGLGGFHLACDAGNEQAVNLLRSRKKRSDKPFALMARDINAAGELCELSQADRELLLGPAHPIVIMKRREDAALAGGIAPGNNTIGLMLPYMPLHLFLFGADPNVPAEFKALVMTSGNISDEPIVTSNEAAWQQLADVADWFLFHDRGIHMRVDDPVATAIEGKPRILRRSRGYAPHPIDLGSPTAELLACGAELKNAFCVTKGHYAILSQHIGDTNNYETLQFFEETLANMKKLFRVEPRAVAHDLHPLYLTSRYASRLALPQIPVQHHHAHVISCMAENAIEGKVIGVAFDGTGYGTDGQIWGGEFLVADESGFERRAHLRYVPLPGGDTAVRQTWRSALSCLYESFGSEMPAHLPFLHRIEESQLSIVQRMLQRQINTVMTSSCGRLFDAVAALVGIRNEATFEGQAAIELECAALSGIEESYPFDIDSSEPALIDMRAMVRSIVLDIQQQQLTGVIAAKFHNTVAAIIGEVCRRIRATDHLNRVCLSGGAFQNRYLLARAVRLLRTAGFELFLHSRVPPNDGGIALGQAVIANTVLQHGA